MGNKPNRHQQKEMMRQALEGPPALRYPGAAQHKAKGGGNGPLVVVTALLAVLAVALVFVIISSGALEQLAGGAGQKLRPGGVGAQGEAQLPKTGDAGEAYVEETLFLGDSNTVRLYSMGFAGEDKVLARQSIGIGEVATLRFVELGGQSGYTMQQAVEILQPTRILMAFGTNNVGNMAADEFARQYAEVLDGLQSASPGTAIVVSAIPPVSERNSYPKLSRAEIERFNEALQEVCAQKGVAFLNSCEALCDADGYAYDGYTDADGIHLNGEGLRAWMDYYRQHAHGE